MIINQGPGVKGNPLKKEKNNMTDIVVVQHIQSKYTLVIKNLNKVWR